MELETIMIRLMPDVQTGNKKRPVTRREFRERIAEVKRVCKEVEILPDWFEEQVDNVLRLQLNNICNKGRCISFLLRHGYSVKYMKELARGYARSRDKHVASSAQMVNRVNIENTEEKKKKRPDSSVYHALVHGRSTKKRRKSK